MKFTIISASHRKESQTRKVCDYLKAELDHRGHQVTIFDCAERGIPMWAENRSGDEWKEWRALDAELQSSDGLIMATPEWNGMATPQAKNIFILAGQDTIGHKPGLLVSVSAGRGGAYPIAELRSSSYKNNRVVWIPEHLIVREVESVLNSDESESEPDQWIRDRTDFALTHLELYTEALRGLGERVPREKRFGNGM